MYQKCLWTMLMQDQAMTILHSPRASGEKKINKITASSTCKNNNRRSKTFQLCGLCGNFFFIIPKFKLQDIWRFCVFCKFLSCNSYLKYIGHNLTVFPNLVILINQQIKEIVKFSRGMLESRSKLLCNFQKKFHTCGWKKNSTNKNSKNTWEILKIIIRLRDEGGAIFIKMKYGINKQSSNSSQNSWHLLHTNAFRRGMNSLLFLLWRKYQGWLSSLSRGRWWKTTPLSLPKSVRVIYSSLWWAMISEHRIFLH